MACLFAATYPERTRCWIILYGTKPRWRRGPDYPWGPTEEEVERDLQLRAAQGWRDDLTSDAWRRWLGPVARDDPAFLEWFARQRRAGAGPAARVALSQMNAKIDTRDILPSIQVPTLVLNRTGDPAAQVDAARFVELPGEGHFFGDIWTQVVATIEEFMTGARSLISTDRFLATILFADIVSSTELAAQIGDASWRNLLARHFAMVRRELTVFGGIEVDTAGDGFVARFDGPSRAIRCVQSIQAADRELRVRLRAGIHTGEVERSNGAVRGIAVHTAARIAELAEQGDSRAAAALCGLPRLVHDDYQFSRSAATSRAGRTRRRRCRPRGGA